MPHQLHRDDVHQRGAETMLTVRLEVVRTECDRDTPDPDLNATSRGAHLLRFVRSGSGVVPDPPTAVLIDELGWKPESQNVP
ncbi:MAG: hypothetical protein ABW221_15660 [Vicinamibacteria bacterium]